MPLSSVMTSLTACVSRFWIVTFAAATAAEDLSVIDPVMEEDVCDHIKEVSVSANIARRNMSRGNPPGDFVTIA
jgi:hypothetical protein